MITQHIVNTHYTVPYITDMNFLVKIILIFSAGFDTEIAAKIVRHARVSCELTGLIYFIGDHHKGKTNQISEPNPIIDNVPFYTHFLLVL